MRFHHHHLSVLLLAGIVAAAGPRQECTSTHAAEHTEHTMNRFSNQVDDELRRRGRATLPGGEKPTTSINNNNNNNNNNAAAAAAQVMMMPREDTATPTTTTTAAVNTNKNKSGQDCFQTGTTSTTSCISETVDGKVKTRDCHPVPLTTSDCLRGYICTMDSNHVDVCMEAIHSLDTGGIIIAIVFGSFVVIGMAYLAFACRQERKHHKKTAAKAEAVALARAATKKQRAAQDVARAPLMQQTQHNHHGPNPFQDQSGHT